MHSFSKKVPLAVLFGHMRSDLAHVRPFGCRTFYQPSASHLPTFEQRVRNGLCFLHEGGGLYHVLTDTGTIRARHTRADEFAFPGMNLDGAVAELSHIGSSDENEDLDLRVPPHNPTDSGGEEESRSRTADLDPLTYVPAEPSKLGSTYAEESDTAYSSAQEDAEDNHGDGQDTGSNKYDLRPRNPVSYTYMVQEEVVKSNDEHSLSVALKSSDRKKWIDAIKEEFDT